MHPDRVTTLTFYRFKGFFPKYIAISMMGISKVWFPKGKALGINKFLGTGSGLGFSRKPNLGQYAHFAVWADEQTAKEDKANNRFLRILKKYAFESEQYYLKAYQSRGVWDRIDPYVGIPKHSDQGGEVLILTRAKVKFKHLVDFWKHVGPSNARLAQSSGRLFSAGMGEWPFSHPITLSVWKHLDDAKRFAYQHVEHARAAQAAREGTWFKEDLFVRYAILKHEKN